MNEQTQPLTLHAARADFPEAFAAVQTKIAEFRDGLIDTPTTELVGARVAVDDGRAALELAVQTDLAIDDGPPLVIGFLAPLVQGSVH